MARFGKAFVGLLVAYILTVIVLLNVLRDVSNKQNIDDQFESLDLLKKEYIDDAKANERLNDKDVYERSIGHGSQNSELSETNDARDASTGTIVANEVVKTVIKAEIRYGPGENGTGVGIDDEAGKPLFNSSEEFLRKKKFHGFNIFVSDIVSLQRKNPDIRHEACKTIEYPDDMDPISVVIIFRDEYPSVVLRTVYSVLGHSPAKYIKEIVLVDDGSKSEELKAIITTHVKNVEKLRLVTNPTPLGLMMARQKGIEATTATYFAVMDGHMEVSPGWLEPLLARLKESPKSMLCPHVGGVNQETFQFHVGKVFDGQFPFFDTLTLSQLWATYSPKFKAARNGSVSPMPMGTVQGMMAVMRKDFFLQLGGFDPGMRQWGSEQMELSIKVWMCGGRVELVPCSKVAHMYRITPWGKVNSSADFLVANSIRTSEVWLDEPYKSLINEVIGQHSKYDIGDLTDRHRIRKENNCKPFQYFIDTVKTFSDVYLLDKIKAKGYVRNMVVDTCLAVEKTPEKTFILKMSKCNNGSKEYFILTEQNQIRSIQACMLKTNPKQNKNDKSITVEIFRSAAYSYKKDAVWHYRDDNTIFHESTKKCLTLKDKSSFTVEQCDGRLEQEWLWQRVVYTE